MYSQRCSAVEIWRAETTHEISPIHLTLSYFTKQIASFAVGTSVFIRRSNRFKYVTKLSNNINLMSFLNTFGPFQTLPWYTPHTLPFQHEYPGCFYVIPVTLAPQPTQILFPHPEVLEAEPSTQPILTTEKRDCLVETSTETDGLFKRNISRPKSIEKCRERRFERNVITNIGNQLLTFLRMRRKNQAVLFRIAPELTEKQLARYYLFAQKIKNSMHSYVSFDKLASIWHVDSETEEERLFR